MNKPAFWNGSSCHQQEREHALRTPVPVPFTPIASRPSARLPAIGRRAARISPVVYEERGSQPMAETHGRPVNWLIECSQTAGFPVSQIIHQRVGASAGLSSCEHMRWTNALSFMDFLESPGSGKTGRPESVTKNNIRQIALKSLKQEKEHEGDQNGGLTGEMQ